MAEVLLNWAVVLATFAALFLIAWWGFNDLSGSKSKVRSSRFNDLRPSTLDFEPETLNSDEAPEARHRLCVEYHRNGHTEHVQWVTDERPGYIGTEAMPGMGGGVLVRHARLAHTGDGFTLENRHGTKPLEWRADGGRSGEVPPGGALPLDGETDVILGDWTVTCREE
jgi:hypothetical protein